MDLEGQDKIKAAVETHGTKDVVVILGNPDADSSKMYAETTTSGDPTWAGPLAGVAYNLPTFHILEAEIKQQIPEAVWNEQVLIMEMSLEGGPISEAVKSVRDAAGITA